MWFSNVKDAVFSTVMGPMYNKVEQWVQFASYVWNVVRSPVFPIRLLEVRIRHKDGSWDDALRAYLENDDFTNTLCDDDVVYVRWAFKDTNYRYYYKKSNPIFFPPYSIERLRSARPVPKIAALSVDDNNQHFETIREHAGPLHNFYNKEFDTSFVTFQEDKKVNIIDTLGKFHECNARSFRFNS